MISIPKHTFIKSVRVPASKSYAQRAILAATLGYDPILLRNCGSSDDVIHIQNVARQLGAIITINNEGCSINPRQSEPERILRCGESGLGIRLTTSIAATFGGEFILEGEGSLTTRKMSDFHAFLPQLGVKFSALNDLVPLKIDGKMKGGQLSIDGSSSSQFISGLLMASPLSEEDTNLTVTNLVSKPYLQMTLDLLSDFGIDIQNKDLKNFVIRGSQKYQNPANYTVEGDWSAAAFWVIYGAINQGIEIQGLNKISLQADRAILEVLLLAGGSYFWEEEVLSIGKNPLTPFEFDASECPDLFPILVTLAASIDGVSQIHGTRRLVNKESNRALTLKKEFAKLGLIIDLQEDTMIIHGTKKLLSAQVDSNNDHRIAMTCGIAASLTNNGIQILNSNAINKSYPEFWDTLRGN